MLFRSGAQASECVFTAFGQRLELVIDSLDTLWIMGLKDQYSRARNWVSERLHFDRNYEASVFETTIRLLGGLLSAHLLAAEGLLGQGGLDLDLLAVDVDAALGLLA